MKFRNLIIYVSVVALSLTYTGCLDMFNPEPDNAFGSERSAINPLINIGFLNTGYFLLPTTYDFSECATDDAVMNNPVSVYFPMVGGAWSPTYDPTSIWATSYNAILNVNKFLSLAQTMQFSWSSAKDDSLYRKRTIAEAYGLRGYYHFLLLRYYGGIGTSGKLLGVPYFSKVLELNSSVWTTLERPDYKSTVDSIAKDLTFAANNLPFSYTGTDRITGVKNKNRLTSLIVNAIKAELYLHVSSPKFNEGNYNTAYCDSAIKYSSNLIDQVGGIAALAGVLKSEQFYDTDADENSTEIIWRMNQVVEATTPSAMALTIEALNYPPSLSGKGQVNPTQDFVNAFPAVNGYPIDNAGSGYDAFKPYLNRDPRLDIYIIRDRGKLGTFTINTSKEDPKDGIEHIGATRTGYYLKKLLRPDFSITNPVAGKKTIRPLIRYTELYLIYAEAATAAHGADWKGTYNYSARDIIRAIRKRAGITGRDNYETTLPTGNFMDLVRNERRIELAFEGFRFWDLRRWGLEVNGVVKGASIANSGGAPVFFELVDEPRNFTKFKYFGPIPNSEILKCPKLEQNGTN